MLSSSFKGLNAYFSLGMNSVSSVNATGNSSLSKCSSRSSGDLTGTKLGNILQNLYFKLTKFLKKSLTCLKKYLSRIQVHPLNWVNIGRESCFWELRNWRSTFLYKILNFISMRDLPWLAIMLGCYSDFLSKFRVNSYLIQRPSWCQNTFHLLY